jgi:hypothetical protein
MGHANFHAPPLGLAVPSSPPAKRVEGTEVQAVDQRGPGRVSIHPGERAAARDSQIKTPDVLAGLVGGGSVRPPVGALEHGLAHALWRQRQLRDTRTGRRGYRVGNRRATWNHRWLAHWLGTVRSNW